MCCGARLRLCRFRLFREVFAGDFKFGVARMKPAQTLFDFDFLGTGVVLQTLDALFLSLDVALEIGVLFFEGADLAMLFGKRA